MMFTLFASALGATVIACGSQSTTTSSGDYEIIGCIFSCFSSASNGGSVSISSYSSTIIINNTMFMSSYSVALGGGIFFNGTTSSMYNVCGSNCMSAASTWPQGGQLFYSGATSSHSITFLSVFHCSNSSLVGTTGAFITAFSTYLNASAINSSFNCLSQTGSCLVSYKNAYPSITFSNFYNCTTGTSRMIYFDYPTLGWLNSSNIVKNSLSDYTLGVIYSYSPSGGILYVHGCVFAGNSGPLFGADNPVTILAYNCWIDHSGCSICTSNAKTSDCYTVTTNTISYSYYGFYYGLTYCSVTFKSTVVFSNFLCCPTLLSFSLPFIQSLLIE